MIASLDVESVILARPVSCRLSGHRHKTCGSKVGELEGRFTGHSNPAAVGPRRVAFCPSSQPVVRRRS